jgi:methyl-accepting chemotaxis protein
MLKAFADIGPHINMAERQSQQINDALAQPIGGVTGLVGACESALAPVLQNTTLSADHRAAVESVLTMVRDTVGALEQVARPFQHETQMVAAQVDRMYMGFQYQDRISQMMALLEGDMARLLAALQGASGPAPELDTWLTQLESQYAMAEQRDDHAGRAVQAGEAPGDETTFF